MNTIGNNATRFHVGEKPLSVLSILLIIAGSVVGFLIVGGLTFVFCKNHCHNRNNDQSSSSGNINQVRLPLVDDEQSKAKEVKEEVNLPNPIMLPPQPIIDDENPYADLIE